MAIVQSCIPLVVVDLGLPPVSGRVAPSSWHRLARSAEASQVALLISSPYRITGTTAEVVIEAAHPRPRWEGDGLAPRVLGGLSSRLELRQSREL
jgi:hypothetical protein